jgi:hypothetical protein
MGRIEVMSRDRILDEAFRGTSYVEAMNNPQRLEWIGIFHLCIIVAEFFFSKRRSFSK